MPAAIAIPAIIAAIGSIAAAKIASDAAKTAAGEQVGAENNALNFQQGVWNQEQQNASPYLAAGNTSLSALMQALSSGKFGAGSIPNAPTFTAPTLAQAQQTPGYQFTQQQGDKGILEGAAAAGGAISGGTLKSLDSYNTNLANTTYGSIFNQALSGYSANLQGYQANLANQAQQYNQMLAPVEVGVGAMGALNGQGTTTAMNVGNIMSQIGNAQASGTVGSANATTAGLTGATNSLTQAELLALLFGNSSQNGLVTQGGSTNIPITSPYFSGTIPIGAGVGGPQGPNIDYGMGPG